MVVLSVVLKLIDVESLLQQNGVNLDLRSLLIFSAVLGMGGLFSSLAMSKWAAKRMIGAHVMRNPPIAANMAAGDRRASRPLGRPACQKLRMRKLFMGHPLLLERVAVLQSIH